MTKHLLTSAMLLLACCTMQAQTILFSGGKLDASQTTIRKSAPRKAKGTIEFGYAQSLSTYIGIKKAETYDCAIYVPAEYAGMTVDAVYFYLYSKSVLKDVSGWASAKLPDSADQADRYVALTTAQLNNYSSGACTATFTEPLTIPAGGCYVGYSFTVTSATSTAGAYPVLLDGSNNDEGGFLMKTTSSIPSWSDFYSGNYGDLCVFASITGNFPDDNVEASSSFGTIYGTKNSTANASVDITNMGTNQLSSVSYKVVGDNEDGTEKTMTLSTPLDMQYYTSVSIPLNTSATTGSVTKNIIFTKANGVEITPDTCSGTVVTLSQLASRKVLEEEYTGTGCGYCPRGITGMDMCKSQISDKWCGVALHLYNSSDPMYPTTYAATSPYYDQTASINTVGGNFSGAPQCILNRVEAPDPFYGNASSGPGIIDDCTRLAAIAPAGKISVNASWTDADSTSIKIESQSQFFYNADKSNFAVAYYVIADSLYGSSWKQSNYYATATASQVDAELGEWAIGGAHRGTKSGNYYYVYGLYFNHVGLAGIGVAKGIDGSIASPIVEDAVQTHSTTVDLSGNKFFANATYTPCINKKNVKIIAFILNTTSGEIINAEECEVENVTTGIESITNNNNANSTATAVYSINGTRLSAPSKGINIIRLANGKTVKVMMK